MFWKNTAWSWEDAADDEDDDGGFLLAADLRRTPDSAPDPDLIHTSTLTRTKQSVSTITTNVSTQHSMGSSGLGSLDSDDANYSSYVTSQHLAINIIRGKDGFGFTICSDCPVRVQAVDPGKIAMNRLTHT
ncbi:hypothetical protein ATANTOWER_020547, partial [Ataeniobius toweri]|nr:hypothetical protein [Ataeniobius toweri]